MSIIDKVKRLGRDKLIAYVKSNEVAIQLASREEQLYIVKKWEKLCPDEDWPYMLLADADDAGAEAEKAKPKPADEKAVEQVLNDIVKPDTPPVMLTRAEQRIAELIAASKDVPDVIEVESLEGHKDPLRVPAGLRRPEFSYRWVANENLQTELGIFGGMWAPVNRMNHPNADQGLFDATGGLRFRNQVVLCCCRRETMENRKKRITNEFALKAKRAVDELQRSYQTPDGKTVIHTEVVDDPGAMPGVELTTDKDYDYGPPNELSG